MEKRGNWSSRQAFILAAIGSAIGLGNIWRFPFKCYESGGGAFLIAYLIAMLTAGIPLLILELSFGHHFKLAAPIAFSKIGLFYSQKEYKKKNDKSYYRLIAVIFASIMVISVFFPWIEGTSSAFIQELGSFSSSIGVSGINTGYGIFGIILGTAGIIFALIKFRFALIIGGVALFDACAAIFGWLNVGGSFSGNGYSVSAGVNPQYGLYVFAGASLFYFIFSIKQLKLNPNPNPRKESILKNEFPKFEWIGWWAVIVGFMITTYYAVVMAWGLNYTVFSATQAWGKDTGDFFYNNFLGLTSGHFDFGGIRLPIVIALIFSWILIVGAIWKGVKTVSKVVYFTVFIPWLLLIVFVIRGVTLPGAMDGLTFYLKPHFEKLLDPSVWVAAYGQVFFSLSIGFGIMIAYASFLPKKADIINSALIIALSDGATAFIGGFAVFGALGYYANMTGQAVQNVLKGGPGLAFVTYPAIINMLPMAKIFGILFFLMLLTLAVDSAFSLVEAVASSLRDKFGWTHKKANLITASSAFVIGLLFTTGAGLYWLDVVDKWLEVFGLSMVVLVECIVLAWFFKLDELRKYANDYSEVKVGKWWNYILKFFVPITVFALIITDAVKLITKGYEGYPSKALLFGGWLVVIIVPIVAIIIATAKRRGEEKAVETIHPSESFVSDVGYKRLHRYLGAILIGGIILISMIVLSNYVQSLAIYVTPLIALYIFLALVGGAIYFTRISLKESHRRESWANQALKSDE